MYSPSRELLMRGFRCPSRVYKTVALNTQTIVIIVTRNLYCQTTSRTISKHSTACLVSFVGVTSFNTKENARKERRKPTAAGFPGVTMSVMKYGKTEKAFSHLRGLVKNFRISGVHIKPINNSKRNHKFITNSIFDNGLARLCLWAEGASSTERKQSTMV